jgi:hypothetical protein
MIHRQAAKSQRRFALLLSVALCFWMFAFASHVHAHEEAGDHGQAPTNCTFCLSLPAAAPAPANDAASVETVTAAHVAVLAVVRVGEEVPSSYLSRGPPAS